MSSSAKITAATLLATAALGAAVFMGGCTVTSDTVDDVDGGQQTNDRDASPDASADATPDASPTCASNQTGEDIGNAECQACLNANCCTQLTTCFSLSPETDKLGCRDYRVCIEGGTDSEGNAVEGCNAKATDEEAQACYATCDEFAATAVQAASEAIDACAGSTACAAVCTPQVDGGT